MLLRSRPANGIGYWVGVDLSTGQWCVGVVEQVAARSKRAALLDGLAWTRRTYCDGRESRAPIKPTFTRKSLSASAKHVQSYVCRPQASHIYVRTDLLAHLVQLTNTEEVACAGKVRNFQAKAYLLANLIS